MKEHDVHSTIVIFIANWFIWQWLWRQCIEKDKNKKNWLDWTNDRTLIKSFSKLTLDKNTHSKTLYTIVKKFIYIPIQKVLVNNDASLNIMFFTFIIKVGCNKDDMILS